MIQYDARIGEITDRGTIVLMIIQQLLGRKGTPMEQQKSH